MCLPQRTHSAERDVQGSVSHVAIWAISYFRKHFPRYDESETNSTGSQACGAWIVKDGPWVAYSLKWGIIAGCGGILWLFENSYKEEIESCQQRQRHRPGGSHLLFRIELAKCYFDLLE